MDGVTQESVDSALHAEETVVLATTHTLSNVPRPGASELSSGQIWSHEDAQMSQHPCLVRSNAGNAMVTDHEDQTTLRTLASDCGHCTTEGLEDADFSAFQVDANSELMFGFHNISTSEDSGFNLHQLRDDGLHATHDNDVGPGQVHDAWVQDHRTFVKDIIQQNYESMPNLQYGYDRSSMLSSLQGEQEGRNDQFLDVQHIFHLFLCP